jgi:heme/copper-type cytochrome/quinol oxidase subunit 2
MREASIAGILCLSLALSTLATAAERRDLTIHQSPDRAPVRVIKVSAERFAFTPSEIVVEKGTVIEFHLTSEDTDHGFRIIDTAVDVAIPKRRRGETVVTYTADKAGRFIIECSRPCGAGHTAMRATLIVK